MKDELLTTADAARLLGVGVSTIKRWADRGELASLRTIGSHRRFRRADVEALRRAEAGETAAPPRGTTLCDELLDSEDEHQVAGHLMHLRAELGTWCRVSEAVGEALVDLGERWARGQLSVAREHLASERLTRALVLIGGTLPLASSAPTALLATAEGDDHTLGLSLVELCLREAGWRSQWMGRFVEVDELLRRLETAPVDLVALSASSASQDADRLEQQALRVREVCRAIDARLVLGGEGAWPEGLRGTARVRSLDGLVECARDQARLA